MARSKARRERRQKRPKSCGSLWMSSGDVCTCECARLCVCVRVCTCVRDCYGRACMRGIHTCVHASCGLRVRVCAAWVLTTGRAWLLTPSRQRAVSGEHLGDCKPQVSMPQARLHAYACPFVFMRSAQSAAPTYGLCVCTHRADMLEVQNVLGLTKEHKVQAERAAKLEQRRKKMRGAVR